MTLSEYIRSDLEALLLRDTEVPFKLTLSAISEHYEVSLMPVRTAVDALIRDEILLKKPNGRLALHPEAAAKRGQAPDPKPPPKSQEDYEREIMERAVLLSLQGKEQYLREEESAARFGLGRSVVRRIFSRLSGAGVIEHVPRCGWRVCSYREEDMIAFIEVREVLETKALELARRALDARELRGFIERNTPLEDGEPRLDNDLHKYWIERCGNRYILDFFRVHGPYYQTLFDYAMIADAAVEVMARQHRQILEAILDGRWQEADASLRAHIREQQPAVLKLIAGFREEPKPAELVVDV